MFINPVQAEIWNTAVEKHWGHISQQELPLPGHDTVFDDSNELHREIQRIMEQMGFSLEDFRLPRSPELATTGGTREVLLMPQEMKDVEVAKDEINDGKLKATVEFTLPAGAYATVVLAELMKCSAAD